ncbi:phosphate ABC transporter substrate-binding protein [Bdellovibrio sp. HCB337]|uniref:phosphate ABC transporter substrate-binding protein n=1 Tax=Bdellovibrio sp. HCB337 TaxID=3394358 RepID=UPI0039A6F145
MKLAFLLSLFVSQALYAADKSITLTGSSTIAPLIMEMGKRFEKSHPGVKVDVQTGGSSRGVKDTREGTADIGMVSRSTNPDEPELKVFTLAKDGVSIILHKDNKVQVLSSEQIIKIYKGEIKNWKDVGGKDAPITVVNKAEGRSTLELFMHYFKVKNSEIKASVVIGDNAQGIKTVAGNPNSIGYVSIGSAEAAIQDKTPIKLLPMNGIAATTEAVKKGTFPISRPLNLVTKSDPNGMIKEFIEFATSNKVNDLVLEQFFVTIH